MSRRNPVHEEDDSDVNADDQEEDSEEERTVGAGIPDDLCTVCGVRERAERSSRCPPCQRTNRREVDRIRQARHRAGGSLGGTGRPGPRSSFDRSWDEWEAGFRAEIAKREGRAAEGAGVSDRDTTPEKRGSPMNARARARMAEKRRP